MEKEIQIPDGFEAKIEGSKVVFVPKVSKDERIRNRIICYLKQDIKEYPEREERINEMLAYLEKQKEQNLEPGYKTQDYSCERCQENAFNRGKEAGLKERKPEIQYVYPKFRVGDLVQHVPLEKWDGPVRVKYIGEGAYSCESDDHKAFKSFPIIRENEYELVEQKPAEWSEEDETCLEYALWCVTKTRRFVAKDACDLDACRCAERWLEFLPERFNLSPKQEWSEEDIELLNIIISDVKRTQRNCGIGTDEWNVHSKAIRLLKSLCPQPSPQSSTNHTVWHNASEEKPTKLPIIHIWYHGNRVCAVTTHEDAGLQAELDDINFQPDDKWAYVEDLLNVQSHWKPSEEQMKALEDFIRRWGESGTMSPQNPTLCAAKSLLNELKKL